MIKGYLTAREVAEKLGVTVGRIRQLVAEKRLTAFKVGQTNLIKASDLVNVQDRKRTGRPKKNITEAKETARNDAKKNLDKRKTA